MNPLRTCPQMCCPGSSLTHLPSSAPRPRPCPQARDPIPQFAKFMVANGLATEADIKAIEKKVQEVVEDCVEYADQSPKPVSSPVCCGVQRGAAGVEQQALTACTVLLAGLPGVDCAVCSGGIASRPWPAARCATAQLHAAIRQSSAAARPAALQSFCSLSTQLAHPLPAPPPAPPCSPCRT